MLEISSIHSVFKSDDATCSVSFYKSANGLLKTHFLNNVLFPDDDAWITEFPKPFRVAFNRMVSAFRSNPFLTNNLIDAALFYSQYNTEPMLGFLRDSYAGLFNVTKECKVSDVSEKDRLCIYQVRLNSCDRRWPYANCLHPIAVYVGAQYDKSGTSFIQVDNKLFHSMCKLLSQMKNSSYEELKNHVTLVLEYIMQRDYLDNYMTVISLSVIKGLQDSFVFDGNYDSVIHSCLEALQ